MCYKTDFCENMRSWTPSQKFLIFYYKSPIISRKDSSLKLWRYCLNLINVTRLKVSNRNNQFLLNELHKVTRVRKSIQFNLLHTLEWHNKNNFFLCGFITPRPNHSHRKREENLYNLLQSLLCGKLIETNFR